MGLLNMLAGIIVKEPISSGIAKFSETIGERVANIFMDVLPDGSKKHYENAADITAKKYNIYKVDEAYVKKALMDAFKEFTGQSNISLKIPGLMQTIYDAISEVSDMDADDCTSFLCNGLYENIMQESDDKGGDKLKEQFKTAREVYVEKNRKTIELNNTSKYGSPKCEILDELSYDNIVFAFKCENILPYECIKELQEGICETYGISYNYNGLGNSISIEMEDGQLGEDAKSICEDLADLLEKYLVDKESILIYAHEIE